MKQIILLIGLLSIAAYTANAQTKNKGLFLESTQTDVLRFNADSVISGSEASVPGLINKVKSLDAADYLIIYKEPQLTGWKVELDSSKYVQILITAGWKKASVGTGGITVQDKAYPDKKHVLVLFK